MKKLIYLIVISLFSFSAYSQSALSKVNNSKDANELRQVLETYSNELNLDLSLYSELSDGYKTAVAKDLLANKPAEGFAKIDEVSYLFNSLSQLRHAMQACMESAKEAQFQIKHLEDLKLGFQLLIGYYVNDQIVEEANLGGPQMIIDILVQLEKEQYDNFNTDLANNSFKYTGFTSFLYPLYVLSNFRLVEQTAINNINNGIINSDVLADIAKEYNEFSLGSSGNKFIINGIEISLEFAEDFYSILYLLDTKDSPFYNTIMQDVKNNESYPAITIFVPLFKAAMDYYPNVEKILAAAKDSKLTVNDFVEGGMVYTVYKAMTKIHFGATLSNKVVDEIKNKTIEFMPIFDNASSIDKELIVGILNGKTYATYKDFINAALATSDLFTVTNITKVPEAKYISIKSAIDDASEDDEIVIMAGTFTENITINKKIILTGNISNPASVVLSNENSNPTITVTKRDAKVRGITIKNTSADSSSIKLSGILGFELTNCIVTAEQGNGIFIEGNSWVTIKENIIKDNGLNGIFYNSNANITKESRIEYNRILNNNNYNINNTSTKNIIATCNWWGTSDKEAIESKLNGDVTFITYLINNNINPQTAQCTGTGEVASDNTLNVIDVYNDVKDISLCENTSLADAIKALPKSIVISDMDGNEYDVNLSWTIADYANGSPGVYSAKATFNLPTEIKQTTPPTTLEVYAVVTVNELPTVVCPEDMIITEKTPIELSASPEGGVFSGNGVENNVFVPYSLKNGDYTITYTYTDMQTSCTNSCQFTIHLDISVGIENKENSFSTVYPNPSNGNFSIELKHSNFDYTIYNTNGVVLYKGSAFDKIDINTELPAGIYFLKINSNSYHNMKKIVIN